MKRARIALDKASDAIDKNQHSEYVEAYLTEAIQQMSAFLKNHKGEFKLTGPSKYTDEEWGRMREQAARWSRQQKERDEMSHEEFVEKWESGEISPVVTQEDLEFQEHMRRRYG